MLCVVGTNQCSTNAKNCSQLCLNTPQGPACSCQENYKLDGDGRTCVCKYCTYRGVSLQLEHHTGWGQD